MLKLLRDLNRESASKLSEADLESAFNKWWPDLELSIKEVNKMPAPTVQKRDNTSKIDEILEIVRSQNNKNDYEDSLNSLNYALFGRSQAIMRELPMEVTQKLDQFKDLLITPPSEDKALNTLHQKRVAYAHYELFGLLNRYGIGKDARDEIERQTGRIFYKKGTDE